MTIIAFFIMIFFIIIINLIFNKRTYRPYDESIFDSYIERKLFYQLKNEGLNPIPQYKVGPYKIDLALLEYRLAIECDGKNFHSSPKQKRNDARKNYYLKKNGWKVCRLSGKTINSNKAIKYIWRRIN